MIGHKIGLSEIADKDRAQGGGGEAKNHTNGSPGVLSVHSDLLTF